LKALLCWTSSQRAAGGACVDETSKTSAVERGRDDIQILPLRAVCAVKECVSLAAMEIVNGECVLLRL
jgi:hypothetical protein